MTATSNAGKSRKSLWSRILAWSNALDEAVDHGPAEESIGRLTRNIAALEDRIRDLEHEVRAHRPN